MTSRSLRNLDVGGDKDSESLSENQKQKSRRTQIVFGLIAFAAVIIAAILLAVLITRSQNRSQTQSQTQNQTAYQSWSQSSTTVTTTTAAVVLPIATTANAANVVNPNRNTSTTAIAAYPGTILSLATWELQLPVAGASGGISVIGPPALNSVSNKYFQPVVFDGSFEAVDFYTPPDGVTTTDTVSPRTELRQLNSDGSFASFSNTGSYALQVKLAVLLFPTNVANGAGGIIVCQLFSSSVVKGPEYVVRAYPSTVLLERGSNANGSIDKQPLVQNYSAGTQMTVTLSVVDGKLTASVDIGTTVTTTIDSADDYYFKAGSYCQTQGSADNGCQVRMYAIGLYGFPGASAFPPKI
ncbi:hypothetical protein HK100_003758 [Physocladia obscura]|uniref:Alginate lyase 2 domain-containing protein n=1 Tax=Physocladia obscura TaxID=109957 RepID=A0AAD5XD06_9FUNG|nr:hypothetical protein HK100_003758 [Physocladia obscura]